MPMIVIPPSRKEEFDAILERISEINEEMQRLSSMNDRQELSLADWQRQMMPLVQEQNDLHQRVKGFRREGT